MDTLRKTANKIIKFFSFFFVTFSLLTARAVEAQTLTGASFGLTNANELPNRLFQIAFGIAIGSGIILVGIGGLTIATATGQPEKIQEGQEQITSALIGLGVVIFSVFILRVLGYDILGLAQFQA